MADKQSVELEQAIKNMETFKSLIGAKAPVRSDKLLALVDLIEESLIVAPSSTRTEYHGAFPGGLIDTNLKVVKTMGGLNRLYEAGLSAEEIVITGLFYDIGKCDLGRGPYFLPKKSDWHNQQGIMFEINPKLIPMSVSARSLYTLGGHGVWLTEEENYAISSVKDRFRPGEESLPVVNEPILAVILQQAVRAVSNKESGRSSLV